MTQRDVKRYENDQFFIKISLVWSLRFNVHFSGNRPLGVLIPSNLPTLSSNQSTGTTNLAVPHNPPQPSGNPTRFPQTQIHHFHPVAACQQSWNKFQQTSPPPLHTVAKEINLSKSFAFVSIIKLITATCNTSLYRNIARWLSSYLWGRHASCRYNEVTSTCHVVRAGVLQGSVVSPIFF